MKLLLKIVFILIVFVALSLVFGLVSLKLLYKWYYPSPSPAAHRVCGERDLIVLAGPGGRIVKTKSGVCFSSNACQALQDIVKCAWHRGDEHARSLLTDLKPEEFIIRKNLALSEDFENAWIIEVRGNLYLWRPSQGNGRMIRLQSEELEHLGGEYFIDTGNFFFGNRNMMEGVDRESFEYLGSKWARDRESCYYAGRRRSLEDCPVHSSDL